MTDELKQWAEDRAFENGYKQGSIKMLDRCINALETFCEMNSYKGIPKEDIRPLLMELKENDNDRD